MALALAVLHPLLSAYRGWGWGWGWWWWWWIIIIFFFWWLVLPPFAYGRRWYGTYRTRSGNDWQAIESRFIESPAAAVVEADAFVTRLLSARGGTPDANAGYRAAHAIALKAQRGQATTEEMQAAMLTYRTLVNGA